MIGMGYDAADPSTGNWFLMRNDGAGVATKVDLGTGCARNTTDLLELIIFLAPNSADFNVVVNNLSTNTQVLNTIYNTDVPNANTALAFHLGARNGAVAAADAIELANLYLEKDY